MGGSRLESIAAFRNHLPVRIRFGDGVVSELPDVLAEEGASRPFALLDPAVAEIPSLERVLAGMDTGVAPPGEPTLGSVELVANDLRSFGLDALVAVGGGSVLDTAKAARLLLAQGGPLGRFLENGALIGAPSIPLVAVPTTAGTGSEVTGGSVLRDTGAGRKVGIASPLLRAQHALVDPELTHALPPEPTTYGGVDALAQGLAAAVVNVRTPIGDAIGLEAARLAAAALPLVVRDGSDRAARAQMACASLMAGLAMNIAEVGSEHWLAHPLGARFGLPHGLTVGLVLAEALDVERRAVPERLERIADALGAPPAGDGNGSRAVTAIRALLDDIGFPTLSSFGVVESDLAALADEALEGWIPVTPHEWTREDVLSAYRAALTLDRCGTPNSA